MELLLKNKLPRGTLLPHLFIHPSLMVSLNGTIILYISPFDDFTFNIMNTENFWTIFIELLLVEIEGTSIHKSSKFWHGHELTCLHAPRADLLMCQRTSRIYFLACRRALLAYVLTYQRALRVDVLTFQRALRAFVLRWYRALRAHLPTYLPARVL